MISAIILAAGESSRMGRLKQLLPWDGTTLLDWQVREARAAGVDDVVIVLGHEVEAIRAALAETKTNTRLVVNEAYLEGRASSLRRGGETVDDTAEAVVVMSVDQPRPAWITRKLIEKWRETGATIVVPRIGGRGGHPVLLEGSLIPDLRRVTDRTLGLRALIDAHRDDVATVEIAGSGLEVNLNTQEDYEAALAAFERGDWAEH
ncbi:MAG: NTP transferase domain-containing protein [Dehalococcoidia bacterium]